MSTPEGERLELDVVQDRFRLSNAEPARAAEAIAGLCLRLIEGEA